MNPEPAAIYRLLAGDQSTTAVEFVEDGSYVESIAASAERQIIVVIPHFVAQFVIDTIRRRRPKKIGMTGKKAVIRRLESRGWKVVARYRLWPNATRPRVAVPEGELRSISWLQRSGVLGGGRYIGVRTLLRSPVLTPWISLTAGATAVLITQSGIRR